MISIYNWRAEMKKYGVTFILIMFAGVVPGSLFATDYIVNGDFEASPWDTGWDNTDGIASNETANPIHGSHSAALKYNTTGKFIQNLSQSLENFDVELYFRQTGTTTGRALNLLLDQTTTVNLRVLVQGTDGVDDDSLQVYNGSWQTISPTNFFDSTSQSYRIRVECRGWGTANPKYSVYWSDAGSSDLKYSAKDLTYFHNTPTAELSRISFARPYTTGDTHYIDDVSIKQRKFGTLVYLK
jgi:hypothetical protein